MTLPKLSFGVTWRAALLLMFVWAAFISTPLGSPNALPSARVAIWGMFVMFAAAFLTLATTSVIWFRRALLIYQLTKLIHEKSGGRDSVRLVFSDGRTGRVSAYGDQVSLRIGEELSSATYFFAPVTSFGFTWNRELLLDPANSSDIPEMRWINSDSTKPMHVNEREFAQWLRRFLEEQKHG